MDTHTHANKHANKHASTQTHNSFIKEFYKITDFFLPFIEGTAEIFVISCFKNVKTFYFLYSEVVIWIIGIGMI